MISFPPPPRRLPRCFVTLMVWTTHNVGLVIAQKRWMMDGSRVNYSSHPWTMTWRGSYILLLYYIISWQINGFTDGQKWDYRRVNAICLFVYLFIYLPSMPETMKDGHVCRSYRTMWQCYLKWKGFVWLGSSLASIRFQGVVVSQIDRLWEQQRGFKGWGRERQNIYLSSLMLRQEDISRVNDGWVDYSPFMIFTVWSADTLIQGCWPFYYLLLSRWW